MGWSSEPFTGCSVAPGRLESPLVATGPSTIRVPFWEGSDASSTFHHRGLASILHRTHLRPDLLERVSLGSSCLMTKPAFE